MRHISAKQLLSAAVLLLFGGLLTWGAFTAGTGEDAGEAGFSAALFPVRSKEPVVPVTAEDLTITVDFPSLQSVNPDIFAWLYVPGTKVNYPVLRSSEAQEDTDYYLDHNLDHSTGFPGCVYVQKRNSAYFTDPDTVLYGHNMKDGSMFGSLHAFEDPEVFAAHPYFFVITESGVELCRIFAAFDYDDRLILSFYDDFTDAETFESYLSETQNTTGITTANTDASVALSGEDRIVTLSTCTATEETRYLVVGKRCEASDPEHLLSVIVTESGDDESALRDIAAAKEEIARAVEALTGRTEDPAIET